MLAKSKPANLSEEKMNCPACDSRNIIKNGSIHSGKRKYRCKDCGRQFDENPQNKVIPRETWDLVDRLLLEKIPLAGIARVNGISEPWLQRYVNMKYENIDRGIDISKKKGA
jgi:transposase-like protein